MQREIKNNKVSLFCVKGIMVNEADKLILITLNKSDKMVIFANNRFRQ